MSKKQIDLFSKYYEEEREKLKSLTDEQLVERMAELQQKLADYRVKLMVVLNEIDWREN